jgi:putative tributyrin esterase
MKKRFRTLERSNPLFQPENLTFVTVKSSYLKGRGDCTFFIPPHLKKTNKDVPVVILLHGVYGSHWAWTYNINVHTIARQLIEADKITPMVLVMPSDGLMGDGSGYFNHGEKDFEKWIVKDVVDLIKEVLPHASNRLKVFISGLSMGGYGALRLMAKFPSVFSGASGLSSITNVQDLLPFLSREEQLYFKEKFGAEELIDYLRKNKRTLPPFRFDCGRNDPLFKSNKKLHKQLITEGIDHVFEELEGGHTNEYWNQQIGRTLIYFNELMKGSEQ